MNLKQKAFLLTICLMTLIASQNVFAQLTSEDLVISLEGASNRIFVNTSPIISVNITNSEDSSKSFNLDYTVTNREGNATEEKSVSFDIPAKTTVAEQINPISDFGSYAIEAKLSCDGTTVTKKQYYAVVPEITKKNDFMGLCTHFNAGTRENAYEAFPQLDKSGAGWIREDLLWSDCEIVAGQYQIPDRFMEMVNYANSHGIKVLAILNSGNSLYDNGKLPTSEDGLKAYGEFCKNIANQLKDKVDAFEIWNEPELFNSESTGGQYAMLLKAAYEGIKHDDGNPDAIVVGGALTAMTASYGAEEYLKNMLSAGAHNYMDAFSFHPYVHARYYPDEYSLKSIFDNINTVEKWLDQAGATKLPIWLTEVGYYDDGGTIYRTEADQAVALARMGSYLKHNSRIERMFIYNYKEKGTDVTEPEHKFGIVSYYYYPKPAYSSLAFMNKMLVDAQPTGSEKTTYGTAYSFTNEYEEDIFSIWTPRGYINEAGDATYKATLKITQGDVTASEMSAVDNTFTIKIPNNKEVMLYDMYGNTIAEKIISGTYTITYEPVYAVIRPKSGIVTDNNGNVKVYGYTKPNSFVTMVAKDGKSEFGSYAYISQTISDSEGRYSLLYMLEPENVYAISVYDGLLTKERLNISGYDVNCRIYDKAGNELTDPSAVFAANEIKIKVTFDNTKDAPTLYAAAYKSDEEIVTVSKTDEVISENVMEIDVKGISNAEKLKIMLWNDALKPLCPNIEIE
ncbi:MAG: hypothetical protein J6C82_08760 [Clostridia bacterium]|nr:hypothetical protein [Clostridia bacterium]